MKIVLDTNVLISALIKNSTTRKLIIELDDVLFFPEPSWEIRAERKRI
ncbi:MAG: hypothetical protein ABH874_06915 [Methanobacteriota archaeon]